MKKSCLVAVITVAAAVAVAALFIVNAFAAPVNLQFSALALPPVTLDMLAVDVQLPAFVPVVLVTFIVSPVTPLSALAVGPCATPLYINVVVVPHVTATSFADIVHVILFIAVVPSLHAQFSFGVAVAV